MGYQRSAAAGSGRAGTGTGPLLLLAVALISACAGPAPREQIGETSAGRAQDSRALVMAIRYEPLDLAYKTASQSGSFALKRPFNAFLALVDGTGEARPYLAETLPRLGTASWQVFADGRMETVHRLRPNLTWQDGQPLTAEDFVFGWQVSRTPGLGVFSPSPQDKMDEVIAPDLRTIVVRWNAPYPDASALTEARDGSLEPLPRHLLAQPFSEYLQDGAKDRFLNLPFWTSEYIGAGPYRLDEWDPGHQLVGVAFAGHALGRPKINRIIMRLFADENTVLSNMLAGDNIDITTRFTLRFEHILVLRQRQWEGTRGTVAMGEPGAPVTVVFQFRPEYLKTPDILDLRVRKALAHASDLEAVVDGVYDGQGQAPYTFVSRSEPYYAEVDRAITKHPYDPRRAEQYLHEAGLSRDREGFFADRAGERFDPDYRTTANVLTSKANAIVVDGWRRMGIDAQMSTLAAALDRDSQVRATFPAIATIGSSGPELFASSEIMTPERRWAGQNRGGWSHREFDRLLDAYNATLDPTERRRHMVNLARLVSDEVPAIMIYYAYTPTYVYTLRLTGPDVGIAGTTSHWNIYDWELR
jgi:peptide/nickel transport system substrate-binding protein